MGDQALVPLVDEASGADFKRKVESISLDCGLEIIVPLGFPLESSSDVGRGVPGDNQLDQGHLEGVGLSVDNHQVRFLGGHGNIRSMVTPFILLPSRSA